jgi:hypothetical protein
MAGSTHAHTHTTPQLAFNSLLAGASVNNLHYQFWCPERSLPVEQRTTTVTHTFSSASAPHACRVDLSEPAETAGVHFFALPNAIATHDFVLTILDALVNVFLERNVPHNLLISADCVHVFPRQPMVIFASGVHPGYCEAVCFAVAL